MIKVSGLTTAGRKMILLGLEEMNIERMRAGDPIHIHADALGFPGEIIIIVGKDAAALQETLAPLVGPNTVVNDESKRPKQ